ncbi:MAG: hypothetical protein ABEH64_07815, partial [Salinirussus sp.]
FDSVYLFEDYGMRLLLPVVTSINVAALAITIFAGILHLKFKQSILRTIGAGVIAGIAYNLVLV